MEFCNNIDENNCKLNNVDENGNVLFQKILQQDPNVQSHANNQFTSSSGAGK